MKAEVKYISVWDMRFRAQSTKYRVQNTDYRLQGYSYCFLFFILCSVFCILCSDFCHAEVIEGIVAIVDDDVILLSEFRETLRAAKSDKKEEVLQGMINRFLLLKEAKRLRIEPLSEKENENMLINEYIEKKLRPFIRISDEEIALFYRQHITSFGNKEILDIRDEIEFYLAEKELNKKLLEHIGELRRKAYIRIQLSDGNH